MLPRHIATILRADVHRSLHIDAKKLATQKKELVWRQEGPAHFVADVTGGAYVLRKVDSRSRVASQRHRWKSLWVPIDSPNIRELALEKRREWARGAAEVHYERPTSP